MRGLGVLCSRLVSMAAGDHHTKHALESDRNMSARFCVGGSRLGDMEGEVILWMEAWL